MQDKRDKILRLADLLIKLKAETGYELTELKLGFLNSVIYIEKNGLMKWGEDAYDGQRMEQIKPKELDICNDIIKLLRGEDDEM